MLLLDLGCGPTAQPGHIGIDINPALNPDKVIDLDTDSLFDYYGDDSIDGIYSNHFLEHVHDLLSLLISMWCISKPGAIWTIQVPTKESEIGNPFHHFQFTEWTFRFFDPEGDKIHPLWGRISTDVGHGTCPIKLREIETVVTEGNIKYVLQVIK